MIEIDGDQGEGGGQILRTALALAAITRQPFRITHIRARRSKSGLLPQHLKSVDAAAAICRAQMEGAYLGSLELVFQPGELRSGRYKWDIGTAGSTSLVLQTVFLPLSLAGSASSLTITGGTHVPHAPSYHYLEKQWLFWLRQIGFDHQVTLAQAGFYPQGGGRIDAILRPVQTIQPLALTHHGPLLTIEGISAAANLDPAIAERQRRQAFHRLQSTGYPSPHIKIQEQPSFGKGTFLALKADYGPVIGEAAETDPAEPTAESPAARCCYVSLGELGKRAERVADEAVDALEAFHHSGACIDRYLADQLILPLAFASGLSELHTEAVTQHLLTNADILQAFLPVKIQIHPELGEAGVVSINPNGSSAYAAQDPAR